MLDLLRMRSIYHLKEADPSAWVVPRLDTAPKAALVELLYDEYGAGDPNKLHHHLFARGLEAVGLRSEYGAYVDDAPAEVLEQNNAMALFGLHRRLRGAAMGHLAAFEATSSMPSRRMAAGLERLGLDATMIGYYTEHVTADAAHEQVAVRAICGALLDQEPALWDDVFFGAFTCMDQEDRVAEPPPRPLAGAGMTVPEFDHADVELCPGGPLLLRGEHVVRDAEGRIHQATGPLSAVCRCGKSAARPWCDGTHKLLPEDKRP